MQKTIFTRNPSPGLIRRARHLTDQLTKKSSPLPDNLSGRGIVTCGGGYTYFTNAWVLIRMLRHQGCSLPIQLWYLGAHEMSSEMKKLIAEYDVQCVDGAPLIRKRPELSSGSVKAGWVLKSVAITRSPFEEVLFLDSDNLPLRDPSFLFDTAQYKSKGAIFWPDSSLFVSKAVWRVFGLRPKEEPEFESGQMLVDKRLNWDTLTLAEKFNFHADVYYRLMWGDKDTFRFAWHRLRRPFAMPDFPPQALQAVGYNSDMLCQHDFEGNRLFQHRNMYKWSLYGENPWIPGFFFENECRNFLEDLRRRWNGRSSIKMTAANKAGALRPSPERSLCDSTWLLRRPEIPLERTPMHEVPQGPATDKSSQWLELRFDRRGMLRTGAGNEAGTFWDLKERLGQIQLMLSDDGGIKVQLTKEEDGSWKGVWIDGRKKIKTVMLTLQAVYPHLQPNNGCNVVGELRRSFGREVHIKHDGGGIGDHIVSAYACTGLARAEIRVFFHTPFASWLSRIKEPNLIITSDISRRDCREIQYDYSNQLRYGTSRTHWYAGGLHPLLVPQKPSIDRVQKTARFPFNRYVLFAPIARRRTREWPDSHWVRLAHLLRNEGYEVVAVGGRHDAERLSSIFSGTQVYWACDHPAAWVIDVMLGSSVYIGLDSGLTHLAALLDIKSIAIHSQLEAGFLWPQSSILSVTPDAHCVFCRWQSDRGWLSSCTQSCSALATVRPEGVFDAAVCLANTTKPNDPDLGSALKSQRTCSAGDSKMKASDYRAEDPILRL
jgi:hypothetical protein